jgi:hypothetical protein
MHTKPRREKIYVGIHRETGKWFRVLEHQVKDAEQYCEIFYNARDAQLYREKLPGFDGKKYFS